MNIQTQGRSFFQCWFAPIEHKGRVYHNKWYRKKTIYIMNKALYPYAGASPFFLLKKKEKEKVFLDASIFNCAQDLIYPTHYFHTLNIMNLSFRLFGYGTFPYYHTNRKQTTTSELWFWSHYMTCVSRTKAIYIHQHITLSRQLHVKYITFTN